MAVDLWQLRVFDVELVAMLETDSFYGNALERAEESVLASMGFVR